MLKHSLNNRIQWLDLARAFAIISVIVCHVYDRVYTRTAEYLSGLIFPSEAMAFVFRTFGRLGVPIFLMITGYLLLDREYDEQNIKKFVKERWLHLLICTWIWMLIANIFLAAWGHKILIKNVVLEMLFIRQPFLAYFWYLPMILGMYLLIPLVAIALKKISIKAIIPILSIFMLFAFVYPIVYEINHLAVINNPGTLENMSLQFSMGFSGGTFGLYMILGYMIKKEMLKKLKTPLLWMIFGLSFIGTVFFQMWMHEGGYAYDLWYDNLLLVIASVSLFELLSRVRTVHAYRAVRFVSYYSFAIYLAHYLILLTFLNLMRLGDISLGNVLNCIFLSVSVFGVTLLLTWAISKIPVVGKYVFYLK